MTTTLTNPRADSHSGRGRTSSALAARRAFLVAAPVLAGVLAVIAAYADPAAGVSGRAMWEVYAVSSERLMFKSLGFHWSYAFWIAPALLLAGYVGGRGAWLANVAAFLGFAGITTMPGLLFVDFYDSAIGQLYGADGAEAVEGLMGSMWGVPAFAIPGTAGFLLALPLAALAAWRGGVVRWWAPVAVVGGYAAFMFSNVMWWGCLVTAVFFSVFAVAVERGTRAR